MSPNILRALMSNLADDRLSRLAKARYGGAAARTSRPAPQAPGPATAWR
ncbi:MAG TPA: hypothetical protein VMF57_10650 [Solirubrobacteraceae bacterium]|nr:hypothetical protein [Solirubrobacteraceae bacterium]